MRGCLARAWGPPRELFHLIEDCWKEAQMGRKLVGLLALALAVGAFWFSPFGTGTARAACNGLNATWSGGGGDMKWSTPGNWAGGTRPTGQYCSISVGISGTEVDGYAYGADTLTVTGNLTVSTGQLAVDDASTISGTLTLSDPFAGITGNGTLTVSGHFTWTAGSINISGGGLIANGGMTISGDNAYHSLAGKVTNPAGKTATWSGANTVSSSAATARFINQGTFRAQAEQKMEPAGLFDNQGTLIKEGTGTTQLRLPIINSGSVAVQAAGATLAIDGPCATSGTGACTHTGSFTVASGATLELGDLLSSPSDGRVNVYAGGISGAGALNFNYGAARGEVRAPFAATGPVGIIGWVDFKVGAGSPVTLSALRIGDPATASRVGTVGGTDDVAVSGLTTIYTGATAGSGTLTANGGITKYGTAALALDSRSLRNGGTFTWASGESGNEIRFDNGATFENLAGGSIDIGGFRSFVWNSGATTPQVKNAGLIRVPNGATLWIQGPHFVQTAGETRLQGGTLDLFPDFQLQGGALTGNGTVNGGIDNTGGTVAPGLSPGTIALLGNYTQGSGGTFALEIGGDSTSAFDRLTVSPQTAYPWQPGNITLGGTLNVTLIDGYVPPVGTTGYLFMPLVAAGGGAGTASGAFATLNLPPGRQGRMCSAADGVSLQLGTGNCGGGGGDASADLAITKTDNASGVIPGGQVTYTITITNNGPDAANGAAVSDTLPGSLSGAGWTCSASGGSSCAVASGAGNINTTVNLASGGTATFTLTATLSGAATGTLSNTASVTAPTGVTDTDTSNNSATDTSAIVAPVSLSTGADVARSPAGTGAGPYAYAPGTVVTLTPQPGTGQTFTGWLVDGVYRGWASPLTVTMDADRTVQATFAQTAEFDDVTGGAAFGPITELASRGTILGYGNGRYGPGDGVQRAQMAALIARAMPAGPGTPTNGTLAPPACVVAGTWDCEDWGTAFTDQGGIVASLWRNAGTLQHYGVALGYTAQDCERRGRAFPCYGPTDPVSHAQTIAFITRAMIAKGYWIAQPNASLPYNGVPAVLATEVRTFHFYTGGVPDAPTTAAGWNGGANRGWFARALWAALDSYWGTDGQLPDGRDAGGFAP
jgi:uncharacterized repeat protein (TIGR01451 family)